MSGMTAIDLNADMGEGFGPYTIGDDSALLDIVTSANIACGFHAGDPEIMAATFRMARERNVAVGAHPGFPDRWGFGRRVLPFSTGEIERIIAYQLGAAQALATYAGHRISYVKVHGALANLAEQEPEIAAAVMNAVHAVDAAMPIVAIALSPLDRMGRERGMRIFSEIFADRAYTDTGQLVSRKQAGAVLHDADFASQRAMRMVRSGGIETVTGRILPTPIDTICVHGDNAEAIQLARKLRSGLEAAGIAIRTMI